jgi:hypothetical protein
MAVQTGWRTILRDRILSLQLRRDNYAIPENTYIFPAAGPTCPTGNGCGNVVYNLFSVDQNFRTSYNYNYNLNLEQKLNASVPLTLGYQGEHGALRGGGAIITAADAKLTLRRPTYASNPKGGPQCRLILRRSGSLSKNC